MQYLQSVKQLRLVINCQTIRSEVESKSNRAIWPKLTGELNMTTIKIDALTTEEKTLAVNLITKMHTAQKSYIQLGHAILEFKTAKLYRETHDTIEAWCKDILDMDTKTARRLVSAAKVCSHLMIEGYTYKSKIKPLPVNEGQARVLTTFLNEENVFVPRI